MTIRRPLHKLTCWVRGTNPSTLEQKRVRCRQNGEPKHNQPSRKEKNVCSPPFLDSLKSCYSAVRNGLLAVNFTSAERNIRLSTSVNLISEILQLISDINTFQRAFTTSFTTRPGAASSRLGARRLQTVGVRWVGLCSISFS